MDNAARYEVYCGMFCQEDGSLVQLGLAGMHTSEFCLRRLTPAGEGWNASFVTLPLRRFDSPNCLQGTADGSRLYIQSWWVGSEKEQSIAVQVNTEENGRLTDAVTLYSGNLCLSSDGGYFMSLTGDRNAWQLQVTDVETGEQRIVDASALEAQSYIYLMGNNAFSRDFPSGMLWCGDLLLLGTENGAALFRFAD